MITAPQLELSGVRHAFFTRHGGASAGIYASLNCGPGSQDDPAHVEENRQRAMQQLGLPAAALSTLYQVHGAEVIEVQRPIPVDARPRADGMVTSKPGIALGILTADCAPLLFADAAAKVIGACHAGWRGALSGVADATIAAMRKLGADRARIVATIGPTIAQDSYEVGPEFPAAFIRQSAANQCFFRAGARDGYFQFDLPGYLQQRLAGLGLGKVVDLARDTASAPGEFFSYRRATLAGEPDYGRQLSAIALTG